MEHQPLLHQQRLEHLPQQVVVGVAQMVLLVMLVVQVVAVLRLLAVVLVSQI
jgi:hypothetical protein